VYETLIPTYQTPRCHNPQNILNPHQKYEPKIPILYFTLDTICTTRFYIDPDVCAITTEILGFILCSELTAIIFRNFVTRLLFVTETLCFLWGRKLSLSAVQANVRIQEGINVVLKRQVVYDFVVLLHAQY
jgi:hypothetical protein